MASINSLFKDFIGKKILVIGDVMIDEYIEGKTQRISPEAPVPVVEMTRKENKIGGAGNVVMNLKELGAEAIICSVIGKDLAAEQLQKLLLKNELDASGLIQSDQRITTVKTRIIANKQQVVRVDSENAHDISIEEEKNLIEYCSNIISKGVDGVIFEDYDKGVLTAEGINSIIELCRSKNIPTAVDPKKRNFLQYKKTTIFKPNLKELKEGLNLHLSESFQVTEISKAVEHLESVLENKVTLVTLSEHGILLKKAKKEYHVSAHMRNISDVSGAGDTVIAVALLCYISGASLKQIAEISNIAGGLACEKPGVARISNKELLDECTRLKIEA